MDLNIAGRKALIGGASKGLGYACAKALVQEGVNIVIVARTPETLKTAATQLQALATHGATVTAIAADITTTAGRELIWSAHAQFDILVTNAGGPPAGDFRSWGEEAWLSAIRANMLTPIELIKHEIDGMKARGFGRIVNITSSAVKAPIDILGLSNGARSGLTGFIAGLARSDFVAHNVTINNLLPGIFDTDRLRSNFATQAQKLGITAEVAKAKRLQSHPAKRLGEPDELGQLCAYLCSAQAAYINGQNMLIDGGSYEGTF